MNVARNSRLSETVATNTNPYPVKLKFTREFTKGALSGIKHEDSMGFCKELDAEEWVSSVNRSNAAGKCEYRVIKWSVSR